MPEYRRTRIEGATYFFTVVTFRRQPILCLPESLDAMRDVITDVAQRHPFQADAWVVLPDHMHFVWTLPEGDSNYSVRWAIVKKELTKRLSSSIGTDNARTQSRQHHREGTVWQRRFWEHQIRDEQDFRAHVDYIHFNPVKHGLVGSPNEWRCSSFHGWVAQGAYEEDWGGDGGVMFPEDVGGE
jgi:putative transposase